MLVEEEPSESGLHQSSGHLSHTRLESLDGSLCESVGSRMIRRSEDMTNSILADKFLKLGTSEWRAIV